MSEFSELQAWLETVSLWKTLLILFLVGMIIKSIIKSLPIVKNAIDIFMNLQLLPQMQDKLEKVHHEVFPNSGGSLRDAVDTAVKGVESTNDKVDNVAKLVNDHYLEQKEIAEKLDEVVDSGLLPREGEESGP